MSKGSTNERLSITNHRYTEKIRNEADGLMLVNADGKPFYGKITICFQKGVMTHNEIYMTEQSG